MIARVIWDVRFGGVVEGFVTERLGLSEEEMEGVRRNLRGLE